MAEDKKHRICEVCGKEFFDPYGHRKTCSDECKRRYISEKLRGQNIEKKPIHKRCVICGESFVAYNSQKVTCSDKCRGKLIKQKNIKVKNDLDKYVEEAFKIGVSYGKYMSMNINSR